MATAEAETDDEDEDDDEDEKEGGPRGHSSTRMSAKSVHGSELDTWDLVLGTVALPAR